mmetsp:Transcript_49301/g.130976  ORF Transcript_49301/g.130976 Transcript_49301/m.130976 type:complete len:236 (+) Transcript_49301:389-1096(+)
MRFRAGAHSTPNSSHVLLTAGSDTILAKPDFWYGRQWCTLWQLSPADRKRSTACTPVMYVSSACCIWKMPQSRPTYDWSSLTTSKSWDATIKNMFSHTVQKNCRHQICHLEQKQAQKKLCEHDAAERDQLCLLEALRLRTSSELEVENPHQMAAKKLSKFGHREEGHSPNARQCQHEVEHCAFHIRGRLCVEVVEHYMAVEEHLRSTHVLDVEEAISPIMDAVLAPVAMVMTHCC